MCDVNSGRKRDMHDCRCDVNPYHRPRRNAVHSTGFPNVRDELRHARARRRPRCVPRARARGRAAPAGARRRTGQASELTSTKQGCASHTGACSSYWRLYAVVYMSTEEETTSDGVQMRSASTVLLSLSSCSSSRPAGARSD